jgi:hypothetical protein
VTFALAVVLQLLSQLVLRNETPLMIRAVVLGLLVLVSFMYAANNTWFQSMKLLSLIPIQRFNWQSEKYTSNYIFRMFSLVTSLFIIALTIYTYQLGGNLKRESAIFSNYLIIVLTVTILFVIKFLANKFYFSLHNSQSLGDQIIDYQYSLNQWFTLAVGCLLIIDIFYLKLNSSVFLVITIVAGIYFLLRLFGTILMLQNNFKYPILTVFVYLCTFEIVPALVTAKVLFVNS